MTAMDKEEILHKMSKKIAQLTKVIFHLNTKNDESELQVQAITNAYELEIGAIVKDANVRVSQAQVLVEQAHSKSAIKQVEALADKYEREKRLASQDMTTFRQQISEREQRNVKMWTEKIQVQLGEISTLRGKCSEQKNILECRTKEFEVARDADAAKIRQLELDCADLRGNIEQETQRREAVEKDFEDLNNQLRSTSSEMGGMEKALYDLRIKYNDDVAQMRNVEAELRHMISSKDASFSAQHEQILSLEKIQLELRDEIAGLAAGNETLLRRNEDLGKGNEVIVGQNTDLTDRNADLTRRNVDLQNAMQKKLSDAEDLDVKLKAALLQAEQAKRQWNMQLDSMGAKTVADLKEKSVQWQEEREKLAQDIDKALLEISEIRQEKDKLQADLKCARLQLDDATKNIGLSSDKNKALHEEIETARHAMESFKSQHQLEMDTLREAIRQKEEELLAEAKSREQALQSKDADWVKNQQEMELRIANMQRELAEALDLARRTHVDEVDQLQAEIARLTRLIDETGQSLHQESSERLAEIAAMRSQEEKLREELAQSKSRCAEQEKASRAALDDLRKNLDVEKARVLEKEQENKKELMKLIKGEETIKKLAGEIDALKQNCKDLKADLSRYAKLAETGGSDTERLTRENSSLKKSLEDITNNKNRVDDELITQHNLTLNVQAELDEARQKLEDMRCQLAQLGASDDERRLAQEKLQQEIHTAKEDAVKMVARITQEHQDKLSKLFEEHKKQLAEQRTSMMDKHSMQLREKLAECNRTHQEKLQALERDHASGLYNLEEQSKEQSRAAELRRKEELAQERSRAESNDAMLRKRILEVETTLSEAKCRISTLESDFVELKKSYARTLAECKENYQSEIKTQLGRHSVEIETITKRHVAEMDDSLQKFEEARALQNQQIDMLQERLQDLQQLYDTRPSRPEDLDTICQLEADVAEKEGAIKQLFDQMQFYKLELVNREQNYNKTFGANPSVGVLNPMAKKNGQVRVLQAQQALPPLGTNGINTKLKVKRPSSGGARNGSANGA